LSCEGASEQSLAARWDENRKDQAERDKPTTTPAQRALAEAAARRAEQKPSPPPEINGRKGPEPTRYGDWEVRGIASDF
jgi:hypothetical protein